jgi:hypothetical protein
MSLTLAARHRNNKLRFLHVTDIKSPAERCMFWIAQYRAAHDLYADALRFPSEYDAGQAEADMDYAREAFLRDRERLRSSIRLERAMMGRAA